MQMSLRKPCLEDHNSGKQRGSAYIMRYANCGVVWDYQRERELGSRTTGLKEQMY